MTPVSRWGGGAGSHRIWDLINEKGFKLLDYQEINNLSFKFQIRVVNMVTKCGRFYITAAYFLLFLLGKFYMWVSTHDDYSSFEMVRNMWTVPSRFCPKTQWNMGSYLLKCPALSSPLLHSVEILRGRISSIMRNGDREGMQYIILRKENLHILL